MFGSLFFKASRFKNLQRGRGSYTDVSEVYYEDLDEEFSLSSYIFGFTADPIWLYSIISLGFYSILRACVTASYAIFNEMETNVTQDLFYLSDVCWFVDILARFTTRYLTKLKTQVIVPKQPHICFYLIDLLSILPIESFTKYEYMKRMLMLNRCFKIVHTLFIFKHMNSLIGSNVLAKMMQIIYVICTIMAMTNVVMSFLICSVDNADCTKANSAISVEVVMTIVSNCITTRGFNCNYGNYPHGNMFVMVVGIITVLGIISVSTANITFLFFTSASCKFNYNKKLQAARKYLRWKKVNVKFIDCVNSFYNIMWQVCDGYDVYMAETENRLSKIMDFKQIIPKSMLLELYVDIFWSAFVHSHLFKGIDVAYLRELSAVMTIQVFTVNQFVFHRDILKQQMIYVFSGVIHIISEDDGESPILTLTDGTCLGEVSLVVPYKSTFKVRCATSCVLQVLDRKQFLKLAQKYPLHYKEVYSRAMKRYQSALSLHKLKESVVSNKINYKGVSMTWLSYTLHHLMSTMSINNSKMHAVQNYYLQNQVTANNFQGYLFSANYLSLLAISERKHATSDTFFIKSTFPYIIRPNTGLVLFWEIIITCIALVAGIYIPYECFVIKKREEADYHNIIFFTIIWWLDVIIKLRIAVQAKYRLISRPIEIITHNLSEIYFILDIIAAIPIECLSGIVASKDFENIVFFNRTIKLMSVFKMLAKWDKRYNSNAIIVRITCSCVFMVYLCFIVGYSYSAIYCPSDCNAFELQLLIYIANQLITGVGNSINEYSNNDAYLKYNCFIVLTMSVILTYIYGQLFSASAYARIDNFKFRHETQKYMKVGLSLQADLGRRIENVAQIQSMTSNGLNIYKPGFFFKNLPKPMLGHWYNQLYVDSMKDMPIFRGFKRYIIVDILQHSTLLIQDLGSGSKLIHVGDILTSFAILATGTCLVLPGVGSKKPEFVTAPKTFNDLEVYLSIPSRSSVVAATNCEVIFLDYTKYKEVLHRYHPTGFLLRGFVPLKQKIQEVTTNQILFDNNHYQIIKPINSFVPIDKEHEKAFKQKFVYYFFLRKTINPVGTFAICWECFRSICGLLAALLYTTTGIIFLESTHYLRILLYILDIIGLCDFYIRMHYGFYSDQGFLITNPLKTAKYYISHGARADMIGALPTNLFINKNFFFVFTSNRLMLMHRYIALLYFYRKDSVTPLNKLYVFRTLPICVILLNYAVTIYIMMYCMFDETDVLNGLLECNKYFLLDTSIVTIPFTAFTGHLYMLYAFVGTITTNGIENFMIKDVATTLLLAILSFAGCCSCGVIAGFFFSLYLSENVDAVLNNLQYNQLCKFMKVENVRPSLLKHVDRHIKRFNLLLPYHIHALHEISPYPIGLYRDILHFRFKSLIKTCLVGADDFVPFIRNLLIHSKYEVIERNGYVITLNDITDRTVILYSGIIDLVEPDGLVDVCLKPGSIIGNLCLLKYNRIMTSFVASTTVELLSIDTLKFAKILHQFPKTEELFTKLRTIHSTHIPGFSNFENEFVKASVHAKRESSFRYVVDIILILIGCHFSQAIFFYQLGAMDCSFYFMFGNLFCDACFITSLMYKIVFPIYKEHRQEAIIIKLLKNKTFLVCVISLIPLNYPIYFITLNELRQCRLMLIPRINVMLRIVYIKIGLKIKHKKYEFLTKVLFLTSFIILMLVFIAEIYIIYLHSQIRNIETDNGNFIYFFFVGFRLLVHTSQKGIHPITMYGVIVTVSMLPVLYFILSIFYGQVISFVHAVNHPRWQYLKKLNRLTSFMNRFEASLPMVERVSTYTSIVWKKIEGCKYPALLNKLPAYLKEAILVNAVGYVIDCHPLFGKCHNDFRRQLISKLQFEYYFHGDYVQYNNMADNTMYCIHYGEIVGVRGNFLGIEDIVTTFVTGDYFGVSQGIYRNKPHKLSYKVIKEACIIYLELDSWEHIMTFFPASKNIIFEEIENLKLSVFM